jgi:hypothetical protein
MCGYSLADGDEIVRGSHGFCPADVSRGRRYRWHIHSAICPKLAGPRLEAEHTEEVVQPARVACFRGAEGPKELHELGGRFECITMPTP